MDKYLTLILKFLNGKKTIIVGITALVIQYLFAEGLINTNTSYLLGGILTLVGGTASVATHRLLDSKLSDVKITHD